MNPCILQHVILVFTFTYDIYVIVKFRNDNYTEKYGQDYVTALTRCGITQSGEHRRTFVGQSTILLWTDLSTGERWTIAAGLCSARSLILLSYRQVSILQMMSKVIINSIDIYIDIDIYLYI